MFSVYYEEILIFCFTQWWYIYNLIYSKPIYCINVNSCHILVFKRYKLLSLQTNLYLHWRDPNVFCVKFLSKLKFNKDIIRSHTTSRPFRTFFFVLTDSFNYLQLPKTIRSRSLQIFWRANPQKGLIVLHIAKL